MMVIKGIVVLIVCFLCAFANAEEVGLLQGQGLLQVKAQLVNKVEEKTSGVDEMPEAQMPSQLLQEMDEYMRKEDERIKDIRLLSLDLEKAGLELKQKEVQVKMVELSKGSKSAGVDAGPSSLNPSMFIKRLMALTVTENFKEAMIEINGAVAVVHEGDGIADGKVFVIDAQGVNIIYPDGKEERLSLNL
jgi:TolA-binding protein